MTTCFGLTDTQLVRNCVGFDEIANENIEQLAAFISNKNVFQRYVLSIILSLTILLCVDRNRQITKR